MYMFYRGLNKGLSQSYLVSAWVIVSSAGETEFHKERITGSQWSKQKANIDTVHKDITHPER